MLLFALKNGNGNLLSYLHDVIKDHTLGYMHIEQDLAIGNYEKTFVVCLLAIIVIYCVNSCGYYNVQ